MLDFLRSVFSTVAESFNTTNEHPPHRFIIRGGLAFGPVIHGRNCGKCAPELKADENYRNAILLGTPMVQAHIAEHSAPPFGIFVHESARVFSPAGTEPLHWVWWQWGSAGQTIWDRLKTELLKHFEWCKSRADSILYAEDRIAAHMKMVEQYFHD
jgi:hypothetical protein